MKYVGIRAMKENIETTMLDNLVAKYLAYHNIIDNKLFQYMIDRCLTVDDFKKYGEHIIKINNPYEEFKYKEELILRCNSQTFFIEVLYK